MIKRDEIDNPNSCLNRARIDEPIFVLRAHDPNSSAVVRTWAERYAKEKKLSEGQGTTKQRTKHAEALRLANHMDAWRAVHGDET